MTKVPGILALVAFLTIGIGCGSSGDGKTPTDGGGTGTGGTTGNSPTDSKALGSLTDSEIGAFCDALAGIAGGYSKERVLTCGSVMVTISFDIGANQAGCKTQFKTMLPPACANLTAGTVKTCVSDTYNSTCDTPDQGPSSCASFFSCSGG